MTELNSISPQTPNESPHGENTATQHSSEQTPHASQKKKRRGVFIWIRRVALALLLLVGIFGITVAVFISVSPLRQWLVKTVVSVVNARLEAKVEFDDFSGSLISDLNLSGLRMIAAGDTILQARELQLHYDLELLLVRKIMLNGVKLVEPRITLLRSMDSSWNFTHLFPPPDSTKKTKPFRWRVEVRDFTIQQGSVRIFDSLSTPTPRLPAFLLTPQLASVLQRAGLAKTPAHRFNAARANFDSVNCSLSAIFNARTKEGTASLYHLSFNETASNLYIRDIAFAVRCDTNRVELKHFRCQTDESLVRMRLVADNVNLFRSQFFSQLDSAQLQAFHLQAAIHTDSISLRDVQRFTPALDDFAGKLALRLDAYGSLPHMTLKTLSLTTVPDANTNKAAQTLVSLEGNFTNTAWNLLSWNDSLKKTNALKAPQILAKTALDVVINPMRISYADLCRFAPGLVAKGKIPNLSGLGFLEIEQGIVRGTMQNLETKLALKSGAGNGTLDASFHAPADARTDTARYAATITVNGVDIGAIANNPSLRSSLNATIKVKGQGLTLKDANTALQLEASNSEIAGRSVDQFSLDATLRDAGIITLNNAHLHWNRPADFVLDDDTDDNIPHNADLWISGLVNLQNAEKPTYRIESRAEHLDLYRLTLFPGSDTDASFTMNLLGSSFNPDSLQGILTLRASDFRTSKKAFEPFSISARLEHLPTPQKPLYREFHLQSELADAHVRGTFSMPSFVSSFANQIDNTIFAVRRKYHFVRDSVLASTYEGLYIKKPTVAKPLDVEFSLLPRDIEISRLFSGFVKIQCRGEMHGSMRGTTQTYTFRVDSSRIREFYYTDDGTSVEIANAALQGTFHHASSGDSLNVIAAKASVSMDSLFRINDLIFRHAKGNANYTGETFDFDARGLYSSVSGATERDSTLAFYAKALLDMRRRDTEFTLDTAWLLYRNDMEWTTQGKMTSVLNKEGLLIEQLALKRPRGETVYLSGQVWFDHFSNAQLILESLPLQDINRLFTKENRIPTLVPLKGMLERLQITLSGIPAAPRMNILLNASNVLYNNTFLGTLQLEATHHDSTVRGTAEVQNPRLLADKPHNISLDSLKTLRVTAKSFPLNLAFTDVEERIVSGKPIDIRFDANSLPLGAVDVFVPGITNLQGSADAHFTISGTTQDSIVYRGDAVIPRASFVFEATNLKYFAEGKASLLNRTVTVEQLQLANDPFDYPKGRALAKGTVTVNGFDITGFDVTAQIPQQGLFVLGNASRIPQPQLYGDVIVSTGEKPLHFYGTLEEPYLRGDVNVLAAKVNFPEIRSVKSENRLFCFETITKDRTGRAITARDCNQQEYTLLMQRDSSQTEDGAPNIAPKQLSTAELAEFSAEQAVVQQHNEHGHENLAISHLPLVIDRASNDSMSTTNGSMPNLPMTNTAMTNLLMTTAPLTFAEKIDYALNVKLKGNFSVTMEWGPFEQLVANLAQENPETPLRYIKTPDRPDEHRLFGDLILRDGSTYKFYRIFNASGKVAFNTGVMSNPRLSINAALRGQRTQPDRSGTSEYLVNLGISGTKKSPNLTMSYLLDNVPGVGDSVKIQNDAIMLLLFGKTQDEFAIGSGVGEAITQNSSSLASRLLTDLLQGTGVVRSADIFFAGGRTGSPLDLQQARVQFTGEISNLGVLWQIGNDIGTNTPNTSFSIDIPFRSFLDQELFRNIVLQITRSAVTANSSVFMRQQREWEVKLGARNSW